MADAESVLKKTTKLKPVASNLIHMKKNVAVNMDAVNRGLVFANYLSVTLDWVSTDRLPDNEFR